jgi:hypothetical protein
MESEQLTVAEEAIEEALEVTAEKADEVQPEEQTEALVQEVLEEICSTENATPDVEALKARIGELEAELAQREELAQRMTRECEEFEAYFPETSLRTLPESVWEKVHAGVPLAAAYALYERGIQNQKKKAEEREARAASCLAGLPGAAGEHYFSPAQVRAMSRREVRENYDRIFESMRHWQ